MSESGGGGRVWRERERSREGRDKSEGLKLGYGKRQTETLECGGRENGKGGSWCRDGEYA